MIHSFLLIGQSNMAGRGFIHEVEPIENKNIKILRNGRWRPLYQPVNNDRDTAGVNLAESFADLYQKEHNVEVGLIPCADGGSCMDQWQEGSLLFDHACYMTELASRTSNIAGILWHQGESDGYDERYPVYEEKLLVMMNAFRKKMGLEDVPLLLGGLGDYLSHSTKYEYLKNCVYVDEALQSAAKKLHRCGFVSAEGLTSNDDFLHFNAKSLREFGERYYREFLKIEDKSRIFEEKSTPDAAIRTEFELL